MAKKIEKGIVYEEKTDTYLLHLGFGSSRTEAFPTIEAAREFRDAAYKSQLEVKKAKLRAYEEEAIKKLLPETYPYPINVIKNFIENPYEDAPVFLVKQFDSFIKEYTNLSERELIALQLYYRDELTCQKIGYKFSVTRERARQIIARAVRKIEYAYQSTKSDDYYKDVLFKEYLKTNKITPELIDKFDLETQDLTIEELDLSIRAYNCLKRAGLATVRDVCEYGLENLTDIKNMGTKAAKEIAAKIKEL